MRTGNSRFCLICAITLMLIGFSPKSGLAQQDVENIDQVLDVEAEVDASLQTASTPDDAYAISQESLTYYRGDIIETYGSFSPDPLEYGGRYVGDEAHLYVSHDGQPCKNVTWTSENPSVAKVESDGSVTPVGFGTTVITGLYDGKPYTCTVCVKEIRFYFWQEYTGDESSSRWVWDYSCCPAVGQSVPYKLEEITYDKNQREVSRHDVTKKYPLSADNASYVMVEPGKITALKAGSDQFDLTSGVYHVLQDTGVPYVQMIRFHIFTSSREEYNQCVQIFDHDDELTLEANGEALGYSRSFTNDDEFMYPSDWSFYRFTTEELTWKSSNTDILAISKVQGSKPGHVYSSARYLVRGAGTVRISACLDGEEIASFKKKVNASIADAKVSTGSGNFAYTGSKVTPNVTVRLGGKSLTRGVDYKIKYANNINVGTAKVIVTGMGSYTGKKSCRFKITKAKNRATAKRLTVKKSFKSKNLKKSAAIVALPKVTTKFGKARWKVSKKDAKGVLCLKNGKVRVSESAHAGTYTIKLKAKVAETANYTSASTKAVTVRVTVR